MKLDEIILKAEAVIERLKPIAEDITGLELNKLNISFEKREDRFLMVYRPNEVILNPKYWDYEKLNSSPKIFFQLELCMAHELGHHVNYTINPYSIEGYNNSRALSITIEGFADYFCLDLLSKRTLSENLVRSERRRLMDIKNNSKYGVGYRFFRAVTRKLGKNESFEIIKRLDASLKELKNPELYIERRRNGNLQKKQQF